MAWLTIAVTVIFVIVLVISLSIVPVKIHMDSTRSSGKTTGNLKIRWLMFLLSYAFEDNQTEILLFSRRIARFTHEKKQLIPDKKQEKTAQIRKKLPPRNYLSLKGPVLRLIKGIFGAFRFNNLDFHITYGMSDPGITGILAGFLHAATGPFQAGHNFSFSPDFRGPKLDWNASGMVTLIPFKLVLPVILFVTNAQVMRFVLRGIRFF